MSLKKYCSSCGNATEYTINIPKICCQCGNSFSQAFADTVKSKPIQKPAKKIVQEDDEDEDDINHNLDFNNIQADVEFEGGNQVDKTTIGSIWGTPQNKDNIRGKTKDNTPKNKKELEKWLLQQHEVKKIEIGE